MPGRAVGAAGTIPVTTTARHVTRERRSVNRDSLHGIPCSFANSLLEGLAAPLRETGLTANGILRSCLFEGGEITIRALLRSRTDPAERQAALAHAMSECIRLKPETHGRTGAEQMSRIGG